MRKISPFLLIIAFFLIGCDYKEVAERESSNQEAQLALDAADSSEVKIDTIFMDFRFSMDQAQVEEHTARLLEQGKLYRNQNYDLQYDLHCDNYKFITTLNFGFCKDKLHAVSLTLTDRLMYVVDEYISIPDISMITPYSTFLDKYFRKGFSPYTVYMNPKENDDISRRLLIKDNLVIYFWEPQYGIDDPIIAYVNAADSKFIDQREQDEKAKKQSKLDQQIKTTVEDI